MGDEAAPNPYAREAVAAMRALPGFRATVEASARGVLDVYLSVDEDLRWVFRDRGRFFIGIAAVMLHHRTALTAAALRDAVASAWREASAGRVRAFLKRMTAGGLIAHARSADGTPLRTLVPSKNFLDKFRAHRLAVADAVAGLDAALGPMRDTIAGGQYTAFEAFLSSAAMGRSDVFGDVPGEAVFFFFQREAGFTILFDLMLSQPNERAQLLDVAAISVNGLAQRHSVSRAHIIRLFTEAEKAGWLIFDRDKREIRFTPEFSDRFERHSAAHFLLHREAWRQYQAAQLTHQP
jgi:hypothetical protein